MVNRASLCFESGMPDLMSVRRLGVLCGEVSCKAAKARSLALAVRLEQPL